MVQQPSKKNGNGSTILYNAVSMSISHVGEAQQPNNSNVVIINTCNGNNEYNNNSSAAIN